MLKVGEGGHKLITIFNSTAIYMQEAAETQERGSGEPAVPIVKPPSPPVSIPAGAQLLGTHFPFKPAAWVSRPGTRVPLPSWRRGQRPPRVSWGRAVAAVAPRGSAKEAARGPAA